jgi:hypothetical protein
VTGSRIISLLSNWKQLITHEPVSYTRVSKNKREANNKTGKLGLFQNGVCIHDPNNNNDNEYWGSKNLMEEKKRI